MTPATRTRRPVALYAVVGAIVVIAAVIALAMAGGDSEPMDGAGRQTGDVSVRGLELPVLQDPTNDPAIGETVPTISGVDFDGRELSFGGGTPTAMLFLAHWCPHCQAEVPVVADWLAAGGKPEGVEVVAVVTGTDPNRPNYPPSAWLDREGLDVPTLLDDEKGTAATAYGLSAFPYWVFVNGDGTVSSRMTGELPVATIEAEVAKITRPR